MSVVQLKTFDPTALDNSGVAQGQISTQISGKCGTIYLYNESLETLLLTDAADQLVGIMPATWAQPFVLKNPTSYINWKVIASQNVTNDYTLKEVQGLAYTTDEDTSKLYTGPLIRQASLGNTANTNTSLGVLDNTTSAPGTQIINIVPSGGAQVSTTLDNVGNTLIQSYYNGVYTTLLQLIAQTAGGPAEVIVAAAGILTKILGDFQIVGTTSTGTLDVYGDLDFKSSGNINLLNANSLNWKDTAGATHAVVWADSGDVVNIGALAAGGVIRLKDEGGTVVATFSTAGSQFAQNASVQSTLNSNIALVVATANDNQEGLVIFAHDSTQVSDLFIVENSAFTSLFAVAPDGSLYIDSGAIVTNGGGQISFNGGQKIILNKVALNGEPVNSQYIKGNGGGAGGSDFMLHNGNPGYFVLDGNAKHVSFRDGNNNGWMEFLDNGSVGVIQSDRLNGPIGFRNANLRLAECKGTGDFIIANNTYYTAQSTFNYAAGGSFDGFDFSETYLVDAEYAPGTVVCPKDVTTVIAYDGTPQLGAPELSQCTHDACNLAGAIVQTPAFCAGEPNVPSMGTYDNTLPMKQAVAHAGRIFMKTAATLAGRVYVCSDGAGGVRQVQVGEKVMALGVTLSPSSGGMVPVLIRPTFVTL